MARSDASAALERERFRSPLTMRAARNVCFSIFSSSGVRGSLGIGLLEQHLRVARDPGQRRVDLVRDAGRQQAERRHLLGDAQLLFDLRTLGHVLENDDGAGFADRLRPPPAAAPSSGSTSIRSPCLGPRADERHPEDRRSLRRMSARRAGGSSTNVRVEELIEPAADRVLARHAVEALERRVPASDSAVQRQPPSVRRRATRGCSR